MHVIADVLENTQGHGDKKTIMKNNNRAYKPEQQSLRALLRDIDAEADDYIGKINNPSGRYFATTLTLNNLLDELKKRHPLSMATRRHGQKLYDRVKNACVKRNNWIEDGWLDNDIRRAFDLPYGHSIIGSTRRDLLRIAKSFASPFIALEEKFEVLFAFFRELKSREKRY